MANDSYYPDAEAPMDGAPTEDNAAETPTEEAAAETETFLVPKTALGADVQVGDERKVKVVAVLEDEAECEAVKEGGTAAEAAPENRMEGARNRLRAGRPSRENLGMME